jgi:hypothetical protein
MVAHQPPGRARWGGCLRGKTGNPNRLNQLERPTAPPNGIVLASRYPGFDNHEARGQAKGRERSCFLHSW